MSHRGRGSKKIRKSVTYYLNGPLGLLGKIKLDYVCFGLGLVKLHLLTPGKVCLVYARSV